jgi:DNA topoisomerase-1
MIGGRWRNLRSEDINAYVREVMGGEHPAKDFRTWNATVIAALQLAARIRRIGPRSRGRSSAPS